MENTAASLLPRPEETLTDGDIVASVTVDVAVILESSFSFLGNKGFMLIQFLTVGCPKMAKGNSRGCQGPLDLEMFACSTAHTVGSES